MRRFLISATTSALLVLALAAPVAAQGPGCSDFGKATAALGPGVLGAMISSVAPRNPGLIAWIVASEHAGDSENYPCATH